MPATPHRPVSLSPAPWNGKPGIAHQVPRPRGTDDDRRGLVGGLIGTLAGGLNGGRGRHLRIARVAMHLSGFGLVALIALAAGSVESAQASADAAVRAAIAAEGRLPGHLATADLPAAAADLLDLQHAARTADRLTTGPAWWLTAHLPLLGADAAGTLDQARALTARARAAGDLPATLDALAAGEADGREADPVLLGRLATGLDRLAGAQRRTGAAAAVARAGDRAAIAAGLLPGLAGTDAPRRWTLCADEGPCRTLRVVDGLVRATSEHRRPGPVVDLLVVTAPGPRAPSAGLVAGPPPGPGAAAAWRASSVLRLLQLGGSTGAGATGTRRGADLDGAPGGAGGVVSSAIPVEQHALDRLADR